MYVQKQTLDCGIPLPMGALQPQGYRSMSLFPGFLLSSMNLPFFCAQSPSFNQVTRKHFPFCLAEIFLGNQKCVFKPSQSENSTDPIFLHHLGKYSVENSVILDIVDYLVPDPLSCSSSPCPKISIFSPHLKELAKSQPVPRRNGCKVPLELWTLHFEWVMVLNSVQS